MGRRLRWRLEWRGQRGSGGRALRQGRRRRRWETNEAADHAKDVLLSASSRRRTHVGGDASVLKVDETLDG